MKKHSLVILLLLAFVFTSTYAFAWSDNDTHPLITEKAAKESILGRDGATYLEDNLGFENGLDEIIFSGNKIRKLISDGARTEDTGTLPAPWLQCSRGLNHFYDPRRAVNDPNGLDEWVFGVKHFKGVGNLHWARGDYSCGGSIEDEPSEAVQKSHICNAFSWKSARLAFKAALEATTETDRNRLFARMFRSVGQVMHLLQDMAVPAHVRMDMMGHLSWQGVDFSHPASSWGNNFESYVQGKPELVTGGGSVQSFNQFADFWDTDIYHGNIEEPGNGLAEYTNANFLSENKMMGAYTHPSITDGDWEVTNYTAEDYNNDYRIYFNKTHGEPVVHLQAKGYLSKYVHDALIEKTTYLLDDICYAEYAHKLIPRAVGYSAGLLNYFFRGTLKVTEAVAIEGDASGIKKISAKAVNKTPNDNTPNGDVFAFARYKTGTESEYSYSVSTSATNESGTPVTSIERSTEAAMIFDFSNKPIPANVEELYLHVVYYGDLGNELETGIAIGKAPVSQLCVMLRSGDYFTLFSVSTNSVVTGLKNPRYGMTDEDGYLLYPDAAPFFVFPVYGNRFYSDFGDYRGIYLNELISDSILDYAQGSAYYDNDQNLLPAHYENFTTTGTTCPNIPSGGTYDISCVGTSTGNEYNQLETASNHFYFFQIASPKDEAITYVSNYMLRDDFSFHTWDNNYRGVFAYYLDPASCDSMEDGWAKCNCYIQAWEHDPARTQTEIISMDTSTDRTSRVTRHTPLGELYTISFDTLAYDYIQDYDGLTESVFTTSGQCGWNAANNVYGLTQIYFGNTELTVNRDDEENTQEKGFAWADDPYHFSKAHAHLKSNTLLHYYVSFPVLKDLTESDRLNEDVYVDRGYNVLAQLNVKDGLYDPIQKTFDIDFEHDWKRNLDFENAIRALINFSLVKSPTVKQFEAYFVTGPPLGE